MTTMIMENAQPEVEFVRSKERADAVMHGWVGIRQSDDAGAAVIGEKSGRKEGSLLVRNCPHALGHGPK